MKEGPGEGGREGGNEFWRGIREAGLTLREVSRKRREGGREGGAEGGLDFLLTHVISLTRWVRRRHGLSWKRRT